MRPSFFLQIICLSLITPVLHAISPGDLCTQPEAVICHSSNQAKIREQRIEKVQRTLGAKALANIRGRYFPNTGRELQSIQDIFALTKQEPRKLKLRREIIREYYHQIHQGLAVQLKSEIRDLKM